MDEDRFNMDIRKFLKVVGVTSQREIELAVRMPSRRERWLATRCSSRRLPCGFPRLGSSTSSKVRSASSDKARPAGRSAVVPICRLLEWANFVATGFSARRSVSCRRGEPHAQL